MFKDRNGIVGGGGSVGGSVGGSTNPQIAYAQSNGSWLPVQSSTSTIAIHTALTRTGKIFYMAGSGWNINNRNGPYTARLLDPGTAGRTQLNLAWTANIEPDINHYNVYRGTVSGFTVTPGTTLPVAAPTTNSYMNTGLTPSTTYYYRVAAVDNAGNIGTLSDERSGTTTSVADTIAPIVTITNPKNNAKVPSGNLTVSGTSQDNTGGSGINNVAVQVDSGIYVTATGTTSWSVIVNIPTRGTHRLTARSQDNAGNFGFSKTINVRV